MYTVQLFDIVMASLMALLLILFFTSLVWSMASVKLKAINEQHDRLYDAMNEEHDAMYESLHTYKEYMDAVQDLAVIYFCYDPTIGPRAQLSEILRLERMMELDPNISQAAHKMIVKAKREHGKKIRKAADRKLERTERDYEARIDVLKKYVEDYKQLYKGALGNTANARSELSAYQSIVSQELDNFIRLPSVRNACIKAINANHKAWQEL